MKVVINSVFLVINSVLDSHISNDHCGSRKILLDNRYDYPELFEIIFEEIKLIGGGTCRKKIIDFPGNYERLTFPKGADRGTYWKIYNRRFHILSKRCKD